MAQQHETDPKAMDAFTKLVEQYRKRPALTVKASIRLKMEEADEEVDGEVTEATFVLASKQRGKVEVNGYTAYLSEGTVHFTHADDEGSYVETDDDGSPYYTMLQAFVSMPFPHLAIAFGEPDMTDVCMQFHPMAPWLVPTAVSKLDVEGTTYDVITMSSDFSTLDIRIDPKTTLINRIDLKMTGGHLVQPGTSVHYVHTYEYDTHADGLEPDAYVFSAGDRQPVDMLAQLQPEIVPETGIVGRRAPGFVLATLDGGAVDLAELEGKVVVLDFWATWCGPCKAALPKLNDIARWASDEQLPVVVLTINVWEGALLEEDSPAAREELVREFWKTMNLGLDVAMDYTDEVAVSYGVDGIPATFIIDADGRVYTRHSGISEDYEDVLKTDILEAMAATEGGS